jgi:hypothetical protein
MNEELLEKYRVHYGKHVWSEYEKKVYIFDGILETKKGYYFSLRHYPESATTLFDCNRPLFEMQGWGMKVME